uniref:Uncharacterized protein n=1 Tax=Romanomermis culicivorax TaxID=13658 RepID=A0A915KGN0_ROMCU
MLLYLDASGLNFEMARARERAVVQDAIFSEEDRWLSCNVSGLKSLNDFGNGGVCSLWEPNLGLDCDSFD